MNRLEVAIERYRQILSKAGPSAEISEREMKTWLTQYVLPAVEQLTTRPSFKENALWPIRALRSGSNTQERSLLDQIDHCLKVSARELQKLSDQTPLRRELKRLIPPKAEEVIKETVEIPAGRGRRSPHKQKAVSELDVELVQLRALADAKEQPLVNLNDYFEPQQEWVEVAKGKWVQRGEWLLAFNPELLPIGNFIVRCLLKRVRLRQELLERVDRKLRQAATQLPGRKRRPSKKLQHAQLTLKSAIGELECRLNSGDDTSLRDACMILTQTYNASHSKPDLSWLGFDSHLMQEARENLGYRLFIRRCRQTSDRIAAALHEVKSFFSQDPELSAIEEAIASSGLVILESRREVYWQKKKLNPEFHKRPWLLLLALAQKARLRCAAESRDVFGDNRVSDSAMSTTWNRLKAKLPSELWSRVASGKRGTYKLDLESHLIHLFP